MKRWIPLATLMLIPGALGATWAILSFGGSIEELEAEERRRAAEALDAFASKLRAELRGTPLPVEGTSTDARIELPAAARIGVELEGRGEPGEALFYFDAATSTLPPEAHLAKARALLSTDQAEAAALLLQRPLRKDAALDGIPLALTSALLRARAAAATGDRTSVTGIWEDVLSGTVPVPPNVAPQVVEALTRHARPLDKSAALEFLWRAKARQVLDLDLVDDSEELVPLPHGGLFLSERNELVSPGAFTEFTESIRADIATRYDMDIASADASALALLEFGGTTFGAAPLGTRGSEGLRNVARLCLGLALASFLLGNLLLFQLSRRNAALSRLKTDFTDLVSHELRTPLTALAVKTEMLAHGDVPAQKILDYQRGLQDDVRALSALVHDILDFGRLEQGRFRLEPVRVSPRQLVAKAVRASRDALRLGGQKLRVQVPRRLPELMVDAAVLARALRNLIDNATRHAPPGSLIELRAEATGRGLAFAVADSGPGLGGADPRQLFEPFRRGEGNGGTGGGTGLGLAIVDSAVRAHGGRVRAEDRPAGGAEFRIELPSSRSAPEETPS